MPKDEVLGHSDESDGIEEYDNALPAWWMGLFAFTVVFGIGYGIYFHTTGDSQVARYEAELLSAAEQWPLDDTIDTSTEAIAAGAEIFATNCAACHMPDLSGGVGPNLKDDEWIHGGTLEEIQKTITDGVPEKGMIAWGNMLGPVKVAQVTAYVHAQGGGQ